MNYQNIHRGIFRARPNRFIAHVELSGELCVCHVKNTGRCRELLYDGVSVWLEKSANPLRKTAYDLVAVEKNGVLFNIDSQAPNRVAAEYLPKLIPGLTRLRPETAFGSSRFDFYGEAGAEKWFVEVKGVTLEEQGTALFPDAPTLRGVKHLEELCRAAAEGYRACVLFIIQCKGPVRLCPNVRTHPAFGEALAAAKRAGVLIHAVDCIVTPGSMTADCPVPVELV